MTQENNKLLIKDLCSRLPYKVKMRTNYGNNNVIVELCGLDTDENTVNICRFRSENGKLCDNNNPLFNRMGESRYLSYLFPLSSMTDEQALELYKLFGIKLTDSIGWDYIKINEVTGITFFLQKGFDIETHLDKLIDWLLKNHFDFRGLIPKGLAIDATGLNIY
jgi:hypothetical protein